MDQRLRLLLVEDSETDALLLVRDLNRAGFEVVFERVDSANDFRGALNRTGWDLIIADFSMPGFSGRAALDIHRERGLDIPFLFVSGTMGEDLAVEAMRAGAADYVMKGNLRRLVPAIQRELREAVVRQERRAADEALRVSEERFAALFHSSPVGISLTTLDDGFFIDANSSLLNMLGYERLEVLGRTTDELGVWADPEQRTRIIRELRRGRAITNRDIQLLAKSGEVRSTLCNFDLVESAGETCLAAFVLDLTERKGLEERLRQAQRLEAMGRLAAGVAHDYNNLLSVILSCCDLLELRHGSGDPQREIGDIRHAVDSAAYLTRQLLAFGRKQVTRPRRVDLSVVVSGARTLLVHALGAGRELTTALADPGKAVALADPGQLEQVLMNLTINAKDAMPGGGRLHVETGAVELTSSDAQADGGWPGRFARLAVSDTGLGMESDTLAHLFEPFFTTKATGQGTGLGLAMVHGIVSQSGGFVRVQSQEGVGSTFEVFLPGIEEPLEKSQEPASTPGRQ